MITWLQKTLKVQYLLYIICIFYGTITASPIPLNGSQSGEYSEGDYLISESIHVPTGKVMTLKAGTVLKFKPYTGIRVSGRLICLGSSLKSILFTSDNSTSLSSGGVESFTQWNGIEIDSGGSIEFDRAVVSNTVFGIKSHKENSGLLLKNVLFKNNSEDFTVGDSLVLVDNNSLYNGKFNIKEEPSKDSLQNVMLLAENQNRKPSKRKIALQVSLATVGVTGAILTAAYHSKYKDAQDSYDENTDNALVDEFDEQRNDYRNVRNAAAVVGGVAFTGLIITFFF